MEGPICPKCGYRRGEADNFPDWGCPACGIAYSKVGTVDSLPQRREREPEPGRQARDEELRTVKKLFYVCTIAPSAIALFGGELFGSLTFLLVFGSVGAFNIYASLVMQRTELFFGAHFEIRTKAQSPVTYYLEVVSTGVGGVALIVYGLLSLFRTAPAFA